MQLVETLCVLSSMPMLAAIYLLFAFNAHITAHSDSECVLLSLCSEDDAYTVLYTFLIQRL